MFSTLVAAVVSVAIAHPGAQAQHAVYRPVPGCDLTVLIGNAPDPQIPACSAKHRGCGGPPLRGQRPRPNFPGNTTCFTAARP